MAEVALQAIVAVLLAVTIAYAVLLNRRLGRLRDGRADMERLVGELNEAMSNAERGIAALRKTAFGDDDALGQRIAEARTVRDEIGFLVDRAEALSARLEEQIGAGRQRERAPTSAAMPTSPSDDSDLFAADQDTGENGGAAGEDHDAARSARATATAWLRNRGPVGSVAGAAGARGLR